MNDRINLSFRLAVAAWSRTYLNWKPLFVGSSQTLERMSDVRFEEDGEMCDGATRCWLRTWNGPIYVEWENLFNKAKKLLIIDDVIDSHGYLLKPLNKEVISKIKLALKPRYYLLREPVESCPFPWEDKFGMFMEDFMEEVNACE